MRNLDDLIRFESECTYLDFKAKQYSTDKHADLLKDVLAFANAPIEGDRYIIFGVSAPANAPRTILGIKRGDFIDAAIWQQLIAENVEPLLQIEYSPHAIDGIDVGILRIPAPQDPPYLMKKDFGALRRGDAFVRKGSFQDRLTRADYDRLVKWKSETLEAGFAGAGLRVGFGKEHLSSSLEIKTVGPDYEMPSEEARKEIEAAIQKRKAEGDSGFAYMAPMMAFTATPYSKRSLRVLQKNLETVEDDYLESNLYQAFEVDGGRLNLWLLNSGSNYIEDVSVKLEVPVTAPKFLIADEIYLEPRSDFPLASAAVRMAPIGYPKVEGNDKRVLISSHVGDLRHHLPIEAFQQDVRIFARYECQGLNVPLTVSVFGKQLQRPLQFQLKLQFI